MKKNLHLATLALALCCLGVNAQNGRNVGTKVPVQAPSFNTSSSQKSTPPTRMCGTEIPHGEWDNWTPEQIAELEKVNYNTPNANNAKQMVQYTIPVVVHVIHAGTAVGTGANISQAQVQDQINILNNDFKGIGLNSSNVPPVWASLKADVEITFCLATKNPTGGVMPEPGIDRRHWNTIAGVSNAGPYSQTTIDGTIKPATIWDPIRYCNMWTCNLSFSLLGYATFPIGTSISCITGTGSNTTDGVVMGYQYFGSIGAAASSAPYHKGRTTTHEVGHWLGLRHITGDASCGNDCVTDTPTQNSLTGGCPTFPQVSCSNGPNGNMFMNFMDYTDDLCMYMFTLGQKARMQQCMTQGTYRSQLTTSAATLCALSATAPTANFSMGTTGCVASAVTVTNNSTGTPAPTYSWSSNPSAGVTFNPNSTATAPSIMFSTPGNYSITVVATNSLGSNSQTKAITITTCAASCNDTITNVSPTDTLWVAIAGADNTVSGCSPKAGYIHGSNCYDDMEKAAFFNSSLYSSITTPFIKSVIVLFYKDGTKGTGGNSTRPVNLKIYGGTLAGGPSSMTALNTVTANIGIITSGSGTNNVTYCANPAVVYASNIIYPWKYTLAAPMAPPAGGFFASVTTPTTTGDTAVIMTDVNATSNSGWELWWPGTALGDWKNLSTAWGGYNSNMAILPEITCSIGMEDRQSEFASNIIVWPNPSNGVFNVITTMPRSRNMSLTVTNALGQQITRAEMSDVTNGAYTVDLSTFTNGVYFITLTSENEKVVKRVVLNK